MAPLTLRDTQGHPWLAINGATAKFWPARGQAPLIGYKSKDTYLARCGCGDCEGEDYDVEHQRIIYRFYRFGRLAYSVTSDGKLYTWGTLANPVTQKYTWGAGGVSITRHTWRVAGDEMWRKRDDPQQACNCCGGLARDCARLALYQMEME